MKPLIFLVLLFVSLGAVGTMDYQDQQALEDFKREYVVITDEKGLPRLLSLKEDRELMELYDGFQQEGKNHGYVHSANTTVAVRNVSGK